MRAFKVHLSVMMERAGKTLANTRGRHAKSNEMMERTLEEGHQTGGKAAHGNSRNFSEKRNFFKRRAWEEALLMVRAMDFQGQK